MPGFDSRLRFATVCLTKAEVDAMTDGLTGLINHRHFHERLGEEVAEAGATGQPLAMLFIDIDGFKGYNDRFGHRAGSEEFSVPLPGVDIVGAADIAERMRLEVLRLVAGQGPAADCLTVNRGVAAMPDHAQNRDDLLERADLAMYAAKRCGTDRVFVFGTADPS